MIVGVFLRYFKTYRGWKYIPLTSQDNFCGLVGDNGVGKSSILEALDCYFNNKIWNKNLATKKSGEHVTPSIVPVFLVDSNFVTIENLEFSLEISNKIKNATTGTSKLIFSDFSNHMNDLRKFISDFNDLLLLPLGLNIDGSFSEAIFSNVFSEDKTQEKALLEFFRQEIEYIYIPTELDAQSFTKLETQEIQVLMGENLYSIISDLFPEKKINELNIGLNNFIDSVSEELGVYSYKAIGKERKSNLRKQPIYDKLIEAFFSNKTLHKKQGSNWLEVSELSSGEKQKAIIDIAKGFLSEHRVTGKNLIIAIDEPESSLHISACFDQFLSLYDISKSCMQLLFSTHWYGFLPIVETGSATIISKNEDSHIIDILNLSFYREQIKQYRANSSKDNILPHNIRLKSINDFIQSVIASITADDPYNWLICEGSSDKIYLTEYFKNEIQTKKFRIVPVGGAVEIQKIYKQLEVIYEDLKNELKGKVFLLSDTDSNLVSYAVKDNLPHLRCNRIVLKNPKQCLNVAIDSSLVSPTTVIEDVLDGDTYCRTLKTFSQNYEDLNFINDMDATDITNVSAHVFDLKESQKQIIHNFFQSENTKFEFAQKYIEMLQSNTGNVPTWIKDIKDWFYPRAEKKPRRK